MNGEDVRSGCDETMSEDIVILQRERIHTINGDIIVDVFNTKTVIIGFSPPGASINLHMGYSNLVCLGDAIQRIIAGEDGYSEQKDDHNSGLVE